MSITETQPNSPVRSGTGRIRNLGAMGEAKLNDLSGRMSSYNEADPEGWAAVNAELERRGMVTMTASPDDHPELPAEPEGLTFAPQKAVAAKATANVLDGSPSVSMEYKFDGWRMVGVVDDTGTVELYARTGTRLTDHLPHVAKVLAEYVPAGTILDGEAGVETDEWGEVQGALSGHPKEPSRAGQVGFFVFDCVRDAGVDLMGETLEVRRQHMDALLANIPAPVAPVAGVWPTPRFEATEEEYQRIIREGFEGAVVKRLDSIYKPGVKGGGWIKLKLVGTEDVVVMSFNAGQGERGQQRQLGSIEFGQYLNGQLVSRGSVGGGYDDPTARWIWEHQNELIGRVIEISHFGKGEGFRSPQWMRLRDRGDKSPEECVWS